MLPRVLSRAFRELVATKEPIFDDFCLYFKFTEDLLRDETDSDPDICRRLAGLFSGFVYLKKFR